MFGWMNPKTRHKGLNDYRTDYSSQPLGLIPQRAAQPATARLQNPSGII
jgi:hypothetical protein